MSKEGLPVALLTGDLTVEQRAAVIGRFRAGTEKVLITTNVSARGLIHVISCADVNTMYVLSIVLHLCALCAVVTAFDLGSCCEGHVGFLK